MSKVDDRLIQALADALSWCGGSADFAPGGKARSGWLRTVLPLLKICAERKGANRARRKAVKW